MTTIEETLTKLTEMRLASMALAVRELMETAPGINSHSKRSSESSSIASGPSVTTDVSRGD